ncbi:MAG: FAD-binding protein [Gallintestinimicrobium sp.]
MDKKRVVIIGGGASGLMASIAAAENGAAVTILEQNESQAKNLRHRKRKMQFHQSPEAD